MDDKAYSLYSTVLKQFTARTVSEGRKRGIDYGIKLDLEVAEKVMWLKFSTSEESHSVSIPIPYEERGLILLNQNETVRAVGQYFIEESQILCDYFSILYTIICGDPAGIIPDYLTKRYPFIQQIIYGFSNNNASVVIYNLQKAINDVINRMPLHTTDMNTFIMNKRIVVIDPEFDKLTDPNEMLNYQVAKSIKHFDKGWTSIGLSDGVLAHKNYLLSYDLKKLTPFGEFFHNPQRNLYSTLGMKGDELPLVRSESLNKLIEKGISYRGWNLFTVFTDIPDVWEDQIVVDESHKNKYITYKKRHQVFGQVMVKEGDRIKRGHVLSKAPDSEPTIFNNICDRAKVRSITDTTINVGGIPTPAFNIVIDYVCKLRDAVKFTNMSANKGVIVFKKIGHAKHPVTGKLRKIDVVVSSKSVQKRKNYAQILEALLNNYNGEKPFVVPDGYNCSIEHVEAGLMSQGWDKDCSWECSTYAGDMRAVCGKVFWGVTHDVESMLWNDGDTTRVNGRSLRTAGLKFSSIEIRALMTRFGKDNPIIDELISYAQGTEDIHQELMIIKNMIGEFPEDKQTIDVSIIREVDQSSGMILPKKFIEGTIVDESYIPEGFIMKLPLEYQVVADKEGKVLTEGIPQVYTEDEMENVGSIATFDRIYVPSSSMRKCWRHSTGNYGLNDIGALINNIVVISHRYIADPDNPVHIQMFYRAVYNYFNRISKMMGSKRGDLSVYGMSVRYPYAAKAVATLSNSIPKNTIEIHKSMAEMIDVVDGDVVLVERFPCLGFTSIRPQKVRVSHDPMCKYTIRVSGTSLKSTNLDFDGDTLFIASFHTPRAKRLLHREWENPNRSCYSAIKNLNKKCGSPHTNTMVLQDYNIVPFTPLTVETHAKIVYNLTSVKANTGPVIALTYNLMRIFENSGIKNDVKTNVAIELFLDRVANSIFEQKHGDRSLQESVTDAVCTGDINSLVDEGFDRGTSTIICNVIKQKAISLGISDLVKYHTNAKKNGGSKIINRIVKEQNKVYFASRAQLGGCELLHHLRQPSVDIPSKILKWVLSGKATLKETRLEATDIENKIGKINSDSIKGACKDMCMYIERICSKRKENNISRRTQQILHLGFEDIIKDVGRRCKYAITGTTKTVEHGRNDLRRRRNHIN